MSGVGTAPAPAPGPRIEPLTSGELATATDELLGRCCFPAPPGRISCAVSGGADSLALLALAVASGLQATAVHVDHGLRAGSAVEAATVAAAAARLGAGFEARTVSVDDGQNLEERLRTARFAALPAAVATGHTMDDQAETVLANLLRGSGLDGLAGMAPGPEHPILGLRRAETRALCDTLGLGVFEDPTNDAPRHLRNRIRAELLPLCAEISGRDPVPILARTAALAGDDCEVLDDAADLAVPDPTDAHLLSAAAVPLARRAVRRWLRDVGATAPTTGRGSGHHPPSAADVARVLDVAAGGAVATEVSGGWRVRRSHGRLYASPGVATNVTPVHTDEAAVDAPDWALPAVGPELVSKEALAQRIAELGAAITADYRDDPPLLVAVLKGAMAFVSDLSREIALPVDIDFMAVSSYGSATKTSGVVRIVKDLDAQIEDREVLVVEDIVDSGLTLNYLRRYLQARNPKNVEVCALLVKEGEQRVELDLRYIGFTIPSSFVVGYGLDVDERYRNLPAVHRYRGEKT